MSGAIDRANRDLRDGRPWKARARLEGALSARPADQDVLDLLAATCFTMGDLPAAGRYWALTQRVDADVAAARDALHERYPTPYALFTALPIYAPLERYPPAVQRALRELADQAGEPWSAGMPKFRRVLGDRAAAAGAPARAEELAAAGVAAGLVAVWLTGAATIGRWVVRHARDTVR